MPVYIDIYTNNVEPKLGVTSVMGDKWHEGVSGYIAYTDSFLFIFARYTRSIMRKDGLFYGNPTADD